MSEDREEFYQEVAGDQRFVEANHESFHLSNVRVVLVGDLDVIQQLHESGREVADETHVFSDPNTLHAGWPRLTIGCDP